MTQPTPEFSPLSLPETEPPIAELVYVRWFDASYQRGECTLEDLIPQVELESAGILIREDVATISLSMDRYRNDKSWRHIEHIPQVNIVEIRRFQVR